MLAQNTIDAQAAMFNELRQAMETARSLVDVIASHSDAKDATVAEVVLTNHPLLVALRRKMSVPYRFVAADLSEVKTWIEARGFKEDRSTDLEYHRWSVFDKGSRNVRIVEIASKIFDGDGRLLPFSSNSWDDDFVRYTRKQVPEPPRKPAAFVDDLDDDVPF